LKTRKPATAPVFLCLGFGVSPQITQERDILFCESAKPNTSSDPLFSIPSESVLQTPPPPIIRQPSCRTPATDQLAVRQRQTQQPSLGGLMGKLTIYMAVFLAAAIGLGMLATIPPG